jgi:hypothetical protein
MRTRTLPVCLVAVFVAILFVPSLHAAWIEGGLEMCTYPSYQAGQELCTDCAGGAIVVWQDDREAGGTWDIYAQRFDADGNILWAATGINVSQQSSDQFSPDRDQRIAAEQRPVLPRARLGRSWRRDHNLHKYTHGQL